MSIELWFRKRGSFNWRHGELILTKESWRDLFRTARKYRSKYIICIKYKNVFVPIIPED